MEKKRKIIAIINPISGTSNKEYVPQTISETIDNDKFDVIIRFTKSAGHATDLAKKAIQEKFYAVLAVGGDGTVNEIASALRDSDTALGMIG